MSKVVPLNITRRDFAATLSAIAGATVIGAAADAAALDTLGEAEAGTTTPGAWDAYTLADLDAMHEALAMADDGLMAIYNQPRTDIEGPAGTFLADQAETLRRTISEITDAVRVRKAETEAELDTQWRILARAASVLTNYDMERELVALILARHELARLRGAPGA